ncbi:TPA: hypothetical protein MIP48_10910 [Klebsiella pneumoniae]|uniref:DUF6631 family protein n=1 Tax=Klebsiella TaxID=570 RepID=UPI001783AEB1|nr:MULTISPECIES: DUF6631 family protein [Klebsiella]MBD8434066.1 hypothetical protein [Klebsiella pneumoniae]MBR7533409.1 hypothetical protein [Klebsiella michiganensis]MBR7573134.1 hypothetical protein [Klebsiella michiganensis]HBY1005073.1 hypothetical protein [Klebsiella pneumoniae]
MSKQKSADTEDELSVLLSTRNITIAGRGLVIREYTLMDMLQLGDKLDALTHSLAEVMQTPWPPLEEVESVLRKHAGDIPELIACTVEQPIPWVALLPAGEGQTLMDWWWTQNRRFFMNAVVRLETIRATRAKLSASAASSQPSSGPDTTRAGSEPTPSAS